MKKTLSRSLLKPTLEKPEGTAHGKEDRSAESIATSGVGPTPVKAKARVGGAGSAWKAGAAEQSRAALIQNREKTAADILNGRHEISLSPSQVTDKLGTDRRADWKSQEAYKALLASIRTNGQDTPIQVWPSDPDWRPDTLDPEKTDGIEFDLITGRRRHEIAGELDIPIRAILASPEVRGKPDEHFELLYMRFRENEERENLGPFERLLSIGEMYEDLQSTSVGQGITAIAFANRIGVHESIVSRARTVFRSRDAILNKFKTAYDLSFPELQKAVASLSSGNSKASKPKAKPKKLTVIKKVGERKLTVSSQGGKLSISAAGLKLDERTLEGLGDAVAAYLNNHRSD